MKFVVFSLGCKVNQVEGQSIINSLISMGHEATDRLEKADAYVVNTCAVTAEAARKSRQMLSRVRAVGDAAPVYICGCASQEDADFFLQGENVRLVTGAAGKGSLAEKIAEDLRLRASGKDLCTFLPSVYEDDLIPERTRTRAYIKIQDGCDNYCSYCIVPYLRGHSRSRDPKSILAEAKSAEETSKEIVLSGVNLSDYNYNGFKLIDLIYLLKDIGCRKRLGSLEMRIINEEFLSAVKESGFVPHFHLSLQSACDSVLAKMNRKYTIDEFAAECGLIRKFFPDAAITTDIIAGFPTETEEEHRTAMQNIEKLAFADAHVFPYSLRKGTKAAELPQLDSMTKSRRAAEIAALTDKSRRQFIHSLLGKEHEVLIEEKTAMDEFSGYTENYVKVKIKSARDITGELVSVVLTKENTGL